jgi:cytidylate kinase
MAIITISRQFGTAGELVAKRVADKLGYKFIDKEIIHYISVLSGEDMNTVSSYDEEKHSSLKATISKFFDLNVFKEMFGDKEEKEEFYKYIDPKDELFSDVNTTYSGFDSDSFKRTMEKIVLYLRNEGNVVLLGRGGQCLLQNDENSFHIRLYAPFEKRVKLLMEVEGMSEKTAIAKIKEIDKRKANFLNHYFGRDIDDKYLYHMMINTEKFILDEITEIIVAAVKIKSQFAE